jgi:hypothetical protein
MRKIFLIALAASLLVMTVWIMYYLSAHELNIQGGYPFMIPLNFLFVANMGLIAYAILTYIQEKQLNPKWLEGIKQIGGLAAAWGTWSTIIGLFFAFDAIEASKDVIPFPVICGGLKVAVITVLYGLIIYCHSLLGYIGLNLSRQS